MGVVIEDYVLPLWRLVLTVAVALVTGLPAGRLLSMTGHRDQPFEDSEEFPV